MAANATSHKKANNSLEEVEARCSDAAGGIGAILGGRRKVVVGAGGSRVFKVGEIVGDSEVGVIEDHPAGDSGGELLNLSTNVEKESIGGLPSNPHDGEDWDLGEVHDHGGGQSVGVSADVFFAKAEDSLADGADGVLDESLDFL